MMALGVISKKRSFSTSTLTNPTVLVVACNCLLTLVMHTWSLSTMVRWLMPLRTKLSAHQLPTAPHAKDVDALTQDVLHRLLTQKQVQTVEYGACALMVGLLRRQR